MAVVGAALGLLALSTVVVVVHPGPLPGELAYLRWLQGLGRPVPRLAELVRATTGTEASIVVSIPAGAWLIHRSGRAGARAVAIALLVMLVVQPVFKELVDRPRPDTTQVEVRATHSSKSFPSGHSLSTTTVWGAAAAVAWRSGSRWRRAAAGALAVPILATGVASGVQGVHWPSDAIAGTIVGGLAAASIVRTLRSPP